MAANEYGGVLKLPLINMESTLVPSIIWPTANELSGQEWARVSRRLLSEPKLALVHLMSTIRDHDLRTAYCARACAVTRRQLVILSACIRPFHPKNRYCTENCQQADPATFVLDRKPSTLSLCLVYKVFTTNPRNESPSSVG